MHAYGSALAFVLLLIPSLHAAGQAAAGWQQRVHYEMDVRLLADRHRMEGSQRLTYFNNSPDTLHRAFYHLYFNAFQPASMMAERNRQLPDPDRRVVPRIFRLRPNEIGFHHVQSLAQNGVPVRFDVTDTVMEVLLAEPVAPGDSAVFDMTFRSQVPLQTRRNGRDNLEGIDYSMSQWYPKLAAYDERGWHADPYIGREFYAPFGTFDIRLTLPAHYVIGATGVLQNAEEIGHGYQADPADRRTYDTADSLTWHFVAENVHDFAWAADPDYIHDQFQDEEGTTYHLLYLPDVAERWQAMEYWVPSIIQYYSRHYGQYPYPQFTVIQAGDGGMEYPMLTFITGRRSPISLLGVTVHEAAHLWFQGAVANNEARYAWMDEGFANFIGGGAVADVVGRPAPAHHAAHLNILSAHHREIYEPIDTPSDWFSTNSAYSAASYSGGQMILDMLGYVISDTLRDRWFREYFERFRFRHPKPFDVEKVAEDVSGIRLDWFFDQFLTSTSTLDYAVTGLRSSPAGESWHTTVRIQRKGGLVMPVDLRLTMADGSRQWVNIPLTVMEGRKPVPEDWLTTDPWPWTNPEYMLVIHLPQRVVRAEIDPLGRTPDRNRLNNTSRLPLETAFLQPPAQSWFTYHAGYRPLGAYAHDFGSGVGAQLRGTYLFGRHRILATLKLWPEVLFSGESSPARDDESVRDGLDYEIAYTDEPNANLTLGFRASKHLGILENTVHLTRYLGRYPALSTTDRALSFSLIHQYNPTPRAFTIDRFNWFITDHILSARVGYRVDGPNSRVDLLAEAGGSLENLLECRDAEGVPVSCVFEIRQGATRFVAEAFRDVAIGFARARAHVKMGMGTKHLAFAKRFRLGAATVEDAWRNAAFRSISAAFDNALRDAHLSAIQLPGPVAYVLASDELHLHAIGATPIGTSMLAGSFTLTAPVSRATLLRPLMVEAFTGIGTVWGRSSLGEGGFTADNILADAGFALSYDPAQLPALRRWTAQSDVLSSLRLTARFPVWASRPRLIAPDERAFAFRWLLGIDVTR